MKRNNKKTCIITGASRGIGKSTALKYAENGYNLALISRSNELHKVGDECKDYNVNIQELLCDVGDKEMVKNTINAILSKFQSIDVLVNNAGIGENIEVVNMPPEKWETIIRTNLTGTYLFSKYVLPTMISQQKGSIINVSSIFGKKGYYGGSAYSASKFGIIGFTESLAKEVKKDGIRVNSICPGIVNTDFTTNQIKGKNYNKLISPQEIAKIIFSITNNSQNMITGQSIIIDNQ